LEDVDFRWHSNVALDPAPPAELFALTVMPGLDSSRIYRVDVATGVATPVAPNFGHMPSGNVYGIDFNPAADRIRVVNDLAGNFRINPDTSTPTFDALLSPADAKVSGLAYDRVDTTIPPADPTRTTAFAIGVKSSSLYTIGGVNQSPSPDNGELLNAKPLGVSLLPATRIGFDISPSGAAYATLNPDGILGLYTIDLASGAATLIGKLPEFLNGLAIVPAEAPKAIPNITQNTTSDRIAPTVSLGGVMSSMSLKTFLKGIEIKVRASEPAGLEAELLAAARSARLASFNLILASATLSIAPGQRTLKLKPDRSLLGKPTRAFKASLRVTATDAAGNAATARKTIVVKPAAKKKKKKRR